MAISTFAAIAINSSNISMEIFEISKKMGLRSLNYVEQKLELGKDIYAKGKISNDLVKRLCNVLNDFQRMMQEYGVSAHQAYATSTLREAGNLPMVIGTIRQQTGIQVEILSNSEQRFLGYKSIASTGENFSKIITKGTAVLDIGGSSLQISLFDKDMLITTQNFKLGNLRLRERLASLERSVRDYEKLVEEFIHNDVMSFKKTHLKERKIENVILTGNQIPEILVGYANGERVIKKEQFMELYQKIVSRSPFELALLLNIPLEITSLLVPTAIIYRCFMEQLGADTIWVPGMKMTDGIAYDYAQKLNLIRTEHEFDNDIVMAAKNIGKRYGVSKSHVQMTLTVALAIFDSMKKIHGLGNRERLLLECAAYLHDCGKYVSLNTIAECNYQIIMATEIIGLSHVERKIIAHITRFVTLPMESYGNLSHKVDIGMEQYQIIMKLSAILRMANAMDRSHLQKIQKIRANLREDRLMVNLITNEDYTLELGLLEDKLDFFEDVFGIRPVIKYRKEIQGGIGQ